MEHSQRPKPKRRRRYPRAVPCGARVAKSKRFRHMGQCRACQLIESSLMLRFAVHVVLPVLEKVFGPSHLTVDLKGLQTPPGVN